MKKSLLITTTLMMFFASSVYADVCVSNWRATAYGGNKGSFDTICKGEKLFTTWVRGSKEAAQKKLNSELGQKGYVEVGTYFKEGIIVHIKNIDESSRYCTLAIHKGSTYTTPNKNVLDCNDSALIYIDKDYVETYLTHNDYKYVYSHARKERIFGAGSSYLHADLYIYKVLDEK